MNNPIGKITIGRVGCTPKKGYTAVRCDRKTPLGNPFYMPNETKRNEVCDKFRVYLQQKLREGANSLLLEELGRVCDKLVKGVNIELQCHCHPKRCHAETIKACCESLVKRKLSNVP